MEILPIVDEPVFEIPLNTLFPAADAALLAAERDWLCPDHLSADMGMVQLGMKSWLVRTGGRNVLVDTCIGQHKERPRHPAWHRRESDRLLRDLAAHGIGRGDIDFVLCTHLHADHVGWNTVLDNGRWVPTFPNARYAMSRLELDEWRERERALGEPVNHGALGDSILPVVEAGLGLFVSGGDELVPDLVIEPLPGHTSGHMGLLAKRPDGDALFCGDAIHSPLQLVRPDWSSAFCSDPVASAATRIAMLERCADAGITLYPAHFRGAGKLAVRRCGHAFRPA